jgi:4-hydroxy-2-oxoheptanedioate aldolase
METDALFIGPNDLAASMGYFAFDHPKIEEVQQATARVLKASKDAEKFAGHFALSADIGKLVITEFLSLYANEREIAAKRSKQGFHFMNCDADISAITVWMSTEMARMKTLMKK